MSAINQFLYDILEFINGVVNNHGVSIIIFTILMRLVCMPFDYKSRKGMRKMQKIQPKLDALQKKYGNDKEKYQKKQAELMRKEHYNPLSGCLPLLLTWPLMIAMFGAMRTIANEQLVLQVFRYLCGEEAILAGDRFLWIKNIWMTDSFFAPIAPDAASLQALTKEVWQKAYAMLSEGQLEMITQSIAAIGGELDFATDAAMKTSVQYIMTALNEVEAYRAAVATVPGWNINIFIASLTIYHNYNGYLILPALAGLTQVLYTKMNPQPENTNANAQKNGAGNFMKYFFPVLSVFFCLTSNAGFALYWVTSNVATSGLNVVVNKILDNQEKKASAVAGEEEVK